MVKNVKKELKRPTKVLVKCGRHIKVYQPRHLFMYPINLARQQQ